MYWQAELDNNDIVDGSCSDGSWPSLYKYLHDNQLKITSLSIYNENGQGLIDGDCRGYFITNKVSVNLPKENVEQMLIGIGYVADLEPEVRIKWYKNPSMELWTSERRPIDQCGNALVMNPNG